MGSHTVYRLFCHWRSCRILLTDVLFKYMYKNPYQYALVKIFEKLDCMYIQGDHKVFPWLQAFVTRKLRGIQFFFPLKLFCKILYHPFIVTFGFWMQHFQTGGLGETVRHPGHHDHRISPPIDFFLCHVFIVTFLTFSFWMQHFHTGGLGEMVRQPGHHDHRISPSLTSFYVMCLLEHF